MSLWSVGVIVASESLVMIHLMLHINRSLNDQPNFPVLTKQLLDLNGTILALPNMLTFMCSVALFNTKSKLVCILILLFPPCYLFLQASTRKQVQDVDKSRKSANMDSTITQMKTLNNTAIDKKSILDNMDTVIKQRYEQPCYFWIKYMMRSSLFCK